MITFIRACRKDHALLFFLEEVVFVSVLRLFRFPLLLKVVAAGDSSGVVAIFLFDNLLVVVSFVFGFVVTGVVVASLSDLSTDNESALTTSCFFFMVDATNFRI